MPDSKPSSAGFSPETSQRILAKACKAIGVNPDSARLLRLGENAIYHINDLNLVFRIARGPDVLDDARKEVAVSRWLYSVGLLAAHVADYKQPIVVDGYPVTFWEFIASSGGEATIADLAAMLKNLHSLSLPSYLNLPAMDVFGRVDARIDQASDVPKTDRDFLRGRTGELRAAYRELTFPLQPCVVHGDAHVGNLIRACDGSVHLIDFERFAFGQPEIDLATTAVEHRIGWYTDAEYTSFVDTYGFDVTSWHGFSVLQDISELKMTTWIMQNVSHGPEVASEVRTRLDALRDSAIPRHWKPF